VWERVRKNASIDLFCDTRTAGAYVEVFCVRPQHRKDIEEYERSLFSDEKAAPQTCGRHGIIYASMLAAGVVVANLTEYWERGTKKFRFAERADTFTRADVILM
jgi:hypothetical protein